ncbi:hypothetical protein M8C21_021587 [Ambrosia artemisiifolia]|uniref:Uncharacterized protein n=1 Tax=Ambrosia artemisiifolia TaxID=4212 RepID=A0AAD5C716_AMBAR|nr:hypothetical protein M8C21_021587 [Ambrosia artemisiifolia]
MADCSKPYGDDSSMTLCISQKTLGKRKVPTAAKPKPAMKKPISKVPALKKSNCPAARKSNSYGDDRSVNWTRNNPTDDGHDCFEADESDVGEIKGLTDVLMPMQLTVNKQMGQYRFDRTVNAHAVSSSPSSSSSSSDSDHHRQKPAISPILPLFLPHT